MAPRKSPTVSGRTRSGVTRSIEDLNESAVNGGAQVADHLRFWARSSNGRGTMFGESLRKKTLADTRTSGPIKDTVPTIESTNMVNLP